MVVLVVYFLLGLAAAQTCIPGYIWNLTLTSCYPNNPSCVTGFTWNGRNCLPSVYCDNSTYFNGNTCVSSTSGCPRGFTKWRTFCLNCPIGYSLDSNDQGCYVIQTSCNSTDYWNGAGCVKRFETGITIATSTNPVSGANSGLKYVQVLSNQSNISANQQSSMNGGFSQVVSNQSVIGGGTNTSCPQGYRWDGSICQSTLSSGQTIQIYNTTTVNSTAGYNSSSNSSDPISVTFATTTVVSCSKDDYFDGQGCSSQTKGINCIVGYIWNGSVCIPYSVNNTSITTNRTSTVTTDVINVNGSPSYPTYLQCNTGYYFDGRNCMTVSGGIVCISGYIWNGTTCILYTSGNVSSTPLFNNIPCASGFYYNGQVCTPVGQISNCIAGFVWNGSSCVVYTGSQSNQVAPVNQGNQIRSVSQTNSTQITQATLGIPTILSTPTVLSTAINNSVLCLPGFLLNLNNVCVPTVTGCSTGQYYDGVSCQSNVVRLKCADGYTWNSQGTVCVAVQSNVPPLYTGNQYPPLSEMIQPASIPALSSSFPILPQSPILLLPTIYPINTPYPPIYTSSVSQTQNPLLPCNDSQYWNGQYCVQFTGLITCLPGYLWNWSTTQCG